MTIKETINNNLTYKCTVLEEDKHKSYHLIVKCDICGAIIKPKDKHSFFTGLKLSDTHLHGQRCSRYFNQLIENDLSLQARKVFQGKYRIAKERCCNPNNKDYNAYKGKFHFTDYIDFYKKTYSLFKESAETFGLSNISIDRIDNNKGYEDGNIRFVPMSMNLQNKENIVPVMCVNIDTHEIFTAVSIKSLCELYLQEYSKTTIYESIKNNRLFKNKYKIFYIPKTQSTIENIS